MQPSGEERENYCYGYRSDDASHIFPFVSKPVPDDAETETHHGEEYRCVDDEGEGDIEIAVDNPFLIDMSQQHYPGEEKAANKRYEQSVVGAEQMRAARYLQFVQGH